LTIAPPQAKQGVESLKVERSRQCPGVGSDLHSETVRYGELGMKRFGFSVAPMSFSFLFLVSLSFPNFQRLNMTTNSSRTSLHYKAS